MRRFLAGFVCGVLCLYCLLYAAAVRHLTRRTP
jgi:hypothetical protein